MRVCNCVLAGQNGKACCQDPDPPGINRGISWTSDRVTPWPYTPAGMRGGGQMQSWTMGSRAKVRKISYRGVAIDNKPWLVTSHPAGNRTFATWEQAMAYANSRPVLMNSVA